MKLLSIAIPCYNSEEYMEKAINSLLSGGDLVEIIIVNDGSKDRTIEIANEYQEKYPDIIKVVDKENGGHGSAVNAGLENATGLYYKVVDSDDWVNEEALDTILEKIEELKDEQIDMFISNYVYEKVGVERKRVINYHGALPVGEIFTWDDMGKFRKSQNILMHSAIYRTQLLKDCNLELPEHTFYVDNIFVFVPLPYVQKLYYIDVDLYRYFIGRDDQSVNEKVMIGRVDQQLRITKIMMESHDIANIKSKKLQKYMVQYLTMMLVICSILLVKKGDEDSITRKKKLWKYVKEREPFLYKKARAGVLGSTASHSDKISHRILVTGYAISKKIFGFN